ncbi:MAG: prepilin-type N-terminal cleavage/methylation domain-containing protein [Deltaproteobacteria bacterium]|nr:prepilin-type N-terminal cleavage/methylation domain-containing protein [Deltaproteobacteria bacterium]
MLSSICNNRGITLIEVVIAMFITAVGVSAILALQAPAWKSAAKADYLGRATQVLQNQLETTETFIMNPCNTVTTGTTPSTIKVSGMSSTIAGDMTFSLSTTITSIGSNIWRVSVTVTWPTNATGITGHVIVSRQEFFRVGC